jgi:transcriptional regulator with XRE-family HTH domain
MKRRTTTARFRELGEELRRIRAKANLTGLEMAHRTGWGTTKVSRVESGHMKISEVDLIHYLGACRVFPPQANALLTLCQDAHRHSDYWLETQGEHLEDSIKALIYHETTCGSSTGYEPQVVPGLLQTESYARAMIRQYSWRQGTNVEFCVRARMERQQVLRRPIPPRFDFFVHENALRLQVGEVATMHEQLLALVLMSGLPSVMIRVVPRLVERSGVFGGAFRVFRYADHRPLVYLDTTAGGLFLEDEDYVETYRQLVPAIADVALNEGQSREYLAALASDYDRESEQPDAHSRVEKEQL